MAPKIIWIPSSNVVKRVIAGQTILLNIQNNHLLVLNGQAESIWNQLTNAKIHRKTDIVKALLTEYNGAPAEKLKMDVRNFLLTLQDMEFVSQEEQSFLSHYLASGVKFNTSHLSFSERLHQLAAQNNIPISGGLEITQRCHHKCLHCYIDNQPVSYNNELSTKEIFNLLEQIAKKGCLWLLITGGEPLLRRDFCDIYCYAKELGMIITVFTSATNITKRIAKIFSKYPPFLVEATLHGANQETFDAISGISGSFRKFQAGTQILREYNIPFHLKMIVMKQNVREVEDTYKLANDLGAGDFRFDPMVNADFLHSGKIKNLRVTIEEAIKLDLAEPFKKRWRKIFQVAATKRKANKISNKLLFPCRAGKCSFTISADGQLLPCILMRTPAYNLREISFSTAWERLNNYVITTQMQESNLCLGCSTLTCSKCPAWGYLEQNDPNAKSQFACALQQVREKIFLTIKNQRRCKL